MRIVGVRFMSRFAGERGGQTHFHGQPAFRSRIASMKMFVFAVKMRQSPPRERLRRRGSVRVRLRHKVVYATNGKVNWNRRRRFLGRVGFAGECSFAKSCC